MSRSLENISTSDLIRTVETRKRQLRKKLGRYATVKRPVVCPYCKGGPMGVRELVRHKRICESNPYRGKGPKGNKAKLAEAAQAMHEKDTASRKSA